MMHLKALGTTTLPPLLVRVHKNVFFKSHLRDDGGGGVKVAPNRAQGRNPLKQVRQSRCEGVIVG